MLTLEEQQRRAGLRRMRVVATSMLVLAAVVFVVASGLEDEHGWAGYVRATAEAAMVGAVADWFAVTALFRHPLGLPIPHTAIIQRRKDQIGASLGTFVRDNFLHEGGGHGPSRPRQHRAPSRPVARAARERPHRR